MGGERPRRPARWLLAAVPVVLLACSDDDVPDADATTAVDGTTVTTTTATTTTATATTVGSGTRPVPTVPPSTIEGAVDGGEDGVVDASPTIAPAPVDPGAPTTSVVAPTTDLVGDPQPNPDATSPPPPTAEDGPDACERLSGFDIAGTIAGVSGVTPDASPVGDQVCRYAAGGLVAEVHYVPVASVRDDWFGRSGIEPVGEVGGDAVGFSSFVPPGSSGGAGYTIALEGGGNGVIVGVSGTADARAVAAQVAILAREA